MTAQGGFGWSGSGASYTLDPNTGLKTSESLPLAYPSSTWNNSYAYSTDGRLSSATIGTSTTTYAYDSAGNLNQYGTSVATTTLTYDVNNQLLNASVGGSVTTTYTYDIRGRRTAEGPIGNTNQQTFTYDAADHMSHYHYGSPSSIEATFTYDARGQRTHSSITSAGVSTETTYTYDGLNLLSLSAASASTTYAITYLYDENSRPYAAVYQGSDSATPKVFHLVASDHGDVDELLTDTGNPFATYRYDAWGNVVAVTSQDANGSGGALGATLAANIASRQPLRYAGYAYDACSSLYYLSARYYDPATMQFLSKDPAKADGQDSGYEYVDDNPVTRIDPSGEAWQWTKWIPMYKITWAMMRTVAKDMMQYYLMDALLDAYPRVNWWGTTLFQRATDNALSTAADALTAMGRFQAWMTSWVMWEEQVKIQATASTKSGVRFYLGFYRNKYPFCNWTFHRVWHIDQLVLGAWRLKDLIRDAYGYGSLSGNSGGSVANGGYSDSTTPHHM
jgi:RHS repeat-associated protein